ncbi:MAG: ornithine carbamoyltransferase [Actinomycetia bacterium]|nr:ornithine carbamoyltransferase [Actinomycetes bacterium]
MFAPIEGNPLAGRDLLRLFDLTPAEFIFLLDKAAETKALWKKDARAAQAAAPYTGQAVAVILEKPSLRTRISFERAAFRLGAQPIVMSDTSSAFSRGESVKDTIMVMERYVQAIVIRSFAQSRVQEIAHWASVPVINALTDDFHPCQAVADFMTIRECKGRLEGLKVAYLGDGANNMAHVFLEGVALSGMELTIATAAGYDPNPVYLAEAEAMAAATGAQIRLVRDPTEALAAADVVVTDSWASMGAEAEHDKRVADLGIYQVNGESMRLAAADAIFLHCLPAHRNEEVSDEVMDAAYSRIYDEAENRMHAQQALLDLLMAGGLG